jgi:hypothetical protein
MSQQNQDGTTFTLRITEGGGTFRCRATAYDESRNYMRSTFDTTESRPVSIQSPTGSSRPKQLSRNNRVISQQQGAGAFRIGVSTATFRMAG